MAWYLGNETYGPSYASKEFTVKLLSTTLSLTPSSTTQGRTVTFKATLKDESGKPVKDASIDFYVGDTVCGSAKTNAEGVASLSFTPSEAGVFQIRAKYLGGSIYSGSDSEPAVLEVHRDYTLYVILGIFLLVFGIVAWLIKRRW